MVFFFCSMMIKAMNTIMKEFIGQSRGRSIVFSALHPDRPANLGVLSLMEWSHPALLVDVVKVAKKIENSVQPIIGSCFHSNAIKNVDRKAWRTRAELFETDCDMYIEWKLSSTGTLLHVYVQEEKWEVVYRVVHNGKESELECAIILHELSFADRGAQRNVRSAFRLHPRIATSCLSSRTSPP